MIQKHEISLIIADDHPMLLKGLFEELTANNYDVLSTVDNGMRALEAILSLEPTIALLDIDMPLLSGFEVIKMAREKGVATKFIILSFHKESEYITQAKTLQIDGYLLKEDSFSEIEKCIQTVVEGRQYFSASFQNKTLKNADESLRKLELLTPSETTILKLIAQEIDTLAIADTLCVSKRTVEKHRSNIIHKLSLATETNSLMKWALLQKNSILDL